MDLSRYTEKAQQVIFDAKSLAEASNHGQVEPMHLLAALLTQADGVVPQVINRLGRSSVQIAKAKRFPERPVA